MRSRLDSLACSLLAVSFAVASTPALAADADHVKKDLTALYARQAEAMKKRDVAAAMALDTPDFSVKLQNGNTVTRQDLEEGMNNFYTSGQLVRQISLTYTIMALAAQDSQAVVLVEQKDKRVQIRKDGKPHDVEANVIHRDTWIWTSEGWRRSLTEEILQTKFTVDGKPVETKK